MKRIDTVALAALSVIVAGTLFASETDLQIKEAVQNRTIVAVELKDGRKFVAKITGETKNSIFLGRPGKAGEDAVDRKSVVSIKKPGFIELMAFKFMAMKDRMIARLKSFGNFREKIDSWSKYHGEIEAARRSKKELTVRLKKDMLEDAKKAGKVIPGMTQTDVVNILGYPDNIEPAGDGRDATEKWFYKKAGTVIFRNGRVVQ